MNKGIAEKWIIALRSGKYAQGANYLKRSIGQSTLHCCLGVLCELYNESNEKLDEQTMMEYVKEDYSPIKIHGFDGSTGALPYRVMKWAEIGTENCEIGSYHSLAYFNDVGKPFSEIAETIETYWRQL